MKRLLLLLLLVFNFQLAISQTFDVVKIKDSGADDKRINLVILGDGYTSSELSQFETDATTFMNDLFAEEPFASYENYFNVHIIKVISTESGASHPGTASDETSYSVPTQTVNNYFGTTYDSFSIHRLLYTLNQGTISTVLAANFPAYDQALILVNSPYYGGSGGSFPIASTGQDSGEIAIHELGHSFVDLKDEYYPGDALAAEAINMTQETDPSLVRWKNWIGIDNVGVYSYATSGTASTWNRPHQSCKMRYLGYPFCSVCKEGIIEKIHDLVSPIDAYTPTETTISEASFPLNFEINTIATLPSNTLENTWTLNTNSFASNIDIVSIEESDLNTGTNNLTVVVHDATTQLNIDNHESIHVATVSWTIDNTLGVQDAIANDFNIIMYPNPSNDIVHFTLENTLGNDVLVEIISTEGKKIKTINLSNLETSQTDISTLSQGIYIANFYQNNVLIASKKLVKN
ncbi:T9SS type A sorting domain-containing protein [Lacinutrix sp. C3R15]|uniref:T9SS type A sorting domain-containing protein n=1 Tax=Flavobacteriaceae TaxID=49546 RepID=UPI001C083C3A|nr:MULTISPECIES: M64 family metallopeptidase [Flavobacteriaceae]MBU2939346.1 T9SS type A sorting domain-containing protein [Lacinutrix sp. C3R15]MDO6622661.1 M64 family metallopeptidase [Oceanihabitans sp. 1_MG-2023]